jgi:hypothetical protein
MVETRVTDSGQVAEPRDPADAQMNGGQPELRTARAGGGAILPGGRETFGEDAHTLLFLYGAASLSRAAPAPQTREKVQGYENTYIGPPRSERRVSRTMR